MRKVQALLAGSSGKAMVLVSRDEVVWYGFNRYNPRMLIVFNNVENYMEEVHKLSAVWARLS